MEAAMIFPSTLKEKECGGSRGTQPQYLAKKVLSRKKKWPADNFEHEGQASETCEKILNFIQEFLWNIRTIPNIR